MSLKKLAIGGLLCTATVMSAASVAYADPPSSKRDVNAQSDLVISMGSDTTYSLHQRLSTIYNYSEGCTPQGSAQGGAATNGATSLTCKGGTTWASDPLQPNVVTNENYDHNIVVDLFPTGSGNGINALCNNVSVNNVGTVQIARSSRKRNSGECTGYTFYGYAKDAVAPVTWPALNSGIAGLTNFTVAQLQGIFRDCTITKWSDIDASYPSTNIIVYGIQASSGTYATWNAYIGTDPNKPNGANTCATNQNPNQVIFENDAAQIPVANRPNAIYPMSWGAYRSLARLAAGSKIATSLDGITLNVNNVRSETFPTWRYLFMVTKNLDGSSTASQKAAQDFVNWVCANSATTLNSASPASGAGHSTLLNVNYGSLMNNAIGTLEGFVTLSDNSGAYGDVSSSGGRCNIQ